MARPGAIGDLSVALFRVWQPERLFVIFTAHIDESGTHGGSPITVMAAAFGSAKQWQRFEIEYAKMRKRHGFEIFHAKEWKDSDGEFKGWPRQKKYEFAIEFTNLIGNTLAASIVAHLKNDEYDKYYLTNDRPRKARWDTKYAICFRAVLSLLFTEMGKRQHPKNQLHIIIERGAKNAGDAVRIFNWIKDEADSETSAAIPSISFADKKGCPPLAAADFLAYSLNMFSVNRLKPEEQRRPMGASDELKGDIWNVVISPENLTELREQTLLTHAERMRRVKPILSVEQEL